MVSLDKVEFISNEEEASSYSQGAFIELKYTKEIIPFRPSVSSDEVIFIFDVDNCLYKSPDNFAAELKIASERWMKILGKTEEEWKQICYKYRNFVEMFVKECGIDGEEAALKYDVVPEIVQGFKPEKKLIDLIDSLPYRKFVFSNGSGHRVKEYMTQIGLMDSVEGFFCGSTKKGRVRDCSDATDEHLKSDSYDFLLKPDFNAYKFVEKTLGISDPSRIHFFDDSARNIAKAQEIGWTAHLVDGNIYEMVKTAYETLKNNCE